MIKSNQPITIYQVDNGFVISHAQSTSKVGQEQVYQTMAELQQFIASHFDHRQEEVLLDTK